jgi:peptide/nickel transport system permease protein
VILAPSVTYLFAAMTRDGESLGEALRGLVDYWQAIFLHFDLGTANVNGDVMSLRKVMIQGLPVDLGLVLGGVAFGVAFGVGGALLCGPLRGSRRDRVLSFGSALGLSLPVYLLAYMALFGFGRIQGSHPLPFVADTGDYAQPWDHPLVYARAIVTVSAVVAVPLAAACFRMTRGALRDIQDAEHLMTARAKGVGERRLLVRHALPAAAPPVVTLVGVSLPWIVFNVILVEVPYNLPGGFRLAHFGLYLDEVHSHLPSPQALQAVVLEAAAIIALGMLLCDVLGAWLDPRLRTAS